MTDYRRYVDPDSAGGDGTTTALSGATAAFASLSAAEAAGGAANQPPLNLTTNSDTYTIICGSASGTHSADTTPAAVDGWTTSATSNVRIQADASNRASTTFNASKYRLTTATAVANLAIAAGGGGTLVEGLQIKSNYSTNQDGISAGGSGSLTSVIDSCLVIAKGAGIAIYRSNTNNLTILNTVAISPGSIAVLSTAANNIKTYSCTFIGNHASIGAVYRSSGTWTAKNCYAANLGAGAAYSGTITKTNCASDDTSANGTAPQTNIAFNTTNFTNVTSGTENLALPSGSALINVGTNTSGEAAPLNFTDDINGTARGSSWDIGAHEYVAGSTTAQKTILGLARASVKTVDGLAIASVKT